MKYTKGNQTFPLDPEDKTVPTWKVRLTAGNPDGEGIWVKQGQGEVVLLNHSLFIPFPSWGMVIPSQSNPDDKSDLREEIDLVDVFGGDPSKIQPVLHPEAWEQYLKHGQIDEEGNLLILDEADEDESEE